MGMNGVCKSCGGSVDAEGYATGGTVEDKSGEHEMGPLNPEEIDDDSAQQELNRRMRHAALAGAMKGK